MKKLFRKLMSLGIAICVSATFSITSFADYDSRSGLENMTYPSPSYVNSDGQIVLTSVDWLHTCPFFAGYAIVCDSREYIENDLWVFNYSIIDESGSKLSTFNFIGSYRLESFDFYRFVENPEGYVWWAYSSNEDGLYFVVGKLDGTQEWYTVPELCASFSDKIDTVYMIGTFRDGSANIYKVRTEKNNMFDYRESHTAVGSITIDGIYSTSINKKSKYDKEKVPEYGTKQFAESTVTKGWKEDSTGWWYDNGDNTYPINQWKEVDGKYYYFDENGYMLSGCYSPDGYSLDLDGAWVEEIPQMTDEDFNEMYKETLIRLYTTGIFTSRESFREAARNFFDDSAVAEQVIQEIEANYTFEPAQ